MDYATNVYGRRTAAVLCGTATTTQMKMLDYVDTKRTTIAVLKDWHHQQKKLDSAKDELESVDSMLKRITPAYSESGGGGAGGNHVEEKLANGLHKKEAILKGYSEAFEYMEQFNQAWEQLTDEEQYVLRTRYIDTDGNGIRNIMDRFFIERTKAYEKCNYALAKFARKLFW